MLNNRLRTCLVSLLLTLFTVPAFADDPGLWVAVGYSWFWIQNPPDKLIYMGGTQPSIPDYYLPNGTDQGRFIEASIGGQWNEFLGHVASFRVGFLYQNFFNVNTDGKIRNADEVDFLYNYKINARALFVDAQLDLLPCAAIAPYIDAGLGVARIQVDNYSESTLPHQNARVSIQFKEHSNDSLAWRAGAGLIYKFPVYGNNMQLSAAYIWEHMGNAQTGLSGYYANAGGQYLNQEIAGGQLEITLRANIE